jgi:hypothetical protein
MKMKAKLILLLVILVILAGCSSAPNGVLSYSGPTKLTIHSGETIPGTDIVLVEATKDAAKFKIEGQTASKLSGDSLDWKGQVADGVDMSLHYRVAWLGENSVRLIGTVGLKISGAAPQPENWDGKAKLKFTIPVTYFVKKGDRIPGTTLSYKGESEKGAEIGGVEGYPYRKTADSILWTGRLRDNVRLKLVSRVGVYDGSRLQVIGLATIGIQP